jgi:ribosomal protein L12E/L44/L45/RPP1/RPP2
MNLENVILYVAAALFVGLLISMYVKHRAKPVDMNHKAPNVHNVVTKGENKVAAAKPAPAKKAPAKKKVTKKKSTKKVTKKKVASKKGK